MEEANCLHHGLFLGCKKAIRGWSVLPCYSCCFGLKLEPSRGSFIHQPQHNLHFELKLTRDCTTNPDSLTHWNTATVTSLKDPLIHKEKKKKEKKKKKNKKNTRGDKAICSFVCQTHIPSGENVSEWIGPSSGAEERCGAALWSRSQTEECRHNPTSSQRPFTASHPSEAKTQNQITFV